MPARSNAQPQAWSIAMLGCALAAILGCSGSAKKLRNPFAKKETPPATQTATAGAPGSSITQAGFEQSSTPPGSEYTPPGASLEGAAKPDDDKETWRKVADSFKSENIAKNYKRMVGRAPSETIAKKAFTDGEALFKEKKYLEAAKQFHIASDRWPDSILEEDAMFMEGESWFFGDRYAKASDLYSQVAKKYENSRYLDRITHRAFAIGQYWDELANEHWAYAPNFLDKKRPMFDAHGHAMSQYESIRLNDPTGPLADDATFAAGVSNFLHHHYEEADQNFETLRKEYPRSEHQPDAHLLGIRAKLRNYQGAEYDERPILEADKLIDSTIRQFGREMPDERERLVRAQRAIRAQRAEREYVNAEYYYHRKAYGAARYYYGSLVKQWPESQHAQMAQERLAEIKDFPADPPNYWGWLGKIFGERDRRRR